MKTIAMYNLKGGTGKTTSCWCLGSMLAQEKNEKILLIDCDPSGNLTSFFRQSIERQDQFFPNSHQLLRGEVEAKDVIRSFYYNKGRLKSFTRGRVSYYVEMLSPIENESVIRENYEQTESIRIDLIPGDKKANEEFYNDADPFTLQRALSGLDYDHIFLDLPPQTIPGVTLPSILACDGILVPSEPADDSVEGLDQILGLLSQAQDAGHIIELCGIFFTRVVSKETVSKQTIETVRDVLGRDGMVLTSEIRQCAATKKCRHVGMIPLMADRNSILSKDYLALMHELEGRI